MPGEVTARRSAAHGGTVEGCYLPVLTWFTGARCTGPDRHLTGTVVPVGGPTLAARYPSSTPPGHERRGTREGCESGRIGTLGKRVWGNSPWVRIPLPPLGRRRSAPFD